MRKRNKTGILIIAAATLFISACGGSVPEMSEEENAQIVEYAAGLLLKYDVNHHGRLIEEEPEENEAEEEVKTEPEKKSEPEEPTTEEPAAEETQVVDNREEAEVFDNRSIEEFCGIEGVAINYTGYELKDKYPDSSTEEMFFAMNATTDCRLLVLNFNVENISGQDINFDMLNKEIKFKISLNGESPKYALTTMLLNDLSSYTGTIAAGASEDLVLIGEISKEKAETIQTVSLLMRNVSENMTISLN